MIQFFSTFFFDVEHALLTAGKCVGMLGKKFPSIWGCFGKFIS
jgi:hypothetical protein